MPQYSFLKKHFFFLLLLIAVFTSCRNQRNFTYFKDIPDSVVMYSVKDTGYKSIVIKPDDIVQINVSSPNVEANNFFVVPGSSSSTSPAAPGAAPTSVNTYLVDKEGAIDLPLAGRVILAGLTTIEAKKLVKTKVSEYLKEPIVTVRLQNFKVTVLGEVNKPANYIVPNERVTILDAIGYAGDLTIFGQRENVMIIREIDGKKTFTRVNLNSSKTFQSPFYYLQQNDIIYVEPNRAKAASTDMATVRNLTILTSLASFAAIIISRILIK